MSKRTKKKEKWKTIKVRIGTHKVLTQMAGHKQMLEGRHISFDEVVQDLIAFGPAIEVTTQFLEKEPPVETPKEPS